MTSWARQRARPRRRRPNRSGAPRSLRKKLQALAFSAALGPGAAASAQCTYTVQIIEAPTCPGDYPSPTRGEGLNESGHVVGYYSPCITGNHKAYVWTGGPGITTLVPPPGVSESQAFDIANTADNGPVGQIVGQILTNATHPYRGFVYDNGEWVIIEPPPNGINDAHAINDAQMVAGYQTNVRTGYWEATLWQNGTTSVIPTPYGPRSIANDLNVWGAVVGWMGQGTASDSHGFLWENGSVLDLGVVPGGITGNARAINARRQIILNGRIEQKFPEPFLTRAFLWDDGQLTDLGVLPTYDRTAGSDLNNRGEIVGTCNRVQNPNHTAGFIWRDGQMTNLNDLIPRDSNCKIDHANAINDAGQIACTGLSFANLSVVAVLLTPVPEQPGDTDCDGSVGINDLWNVIRDWGSCLPYPAHCRADFNADDVVDVPDLLTVLMNWGAKA